MGLYDKDIREILFNQFLKIPAFISDESTIVVNELNICSGSAIMDIAVINGKIHGFEIKSEHDSLERLQTQATFYNQVFDTITLVLSSKHLEKAISLIPEWWGIFCIDKINDGTFNLKMIKEPKQNEYIDIFNLSQLLWKSELISLLNSFGITKGLKSKTRRELAIMVADYIDDEENIKSFIRETLKNRKTWKALSLQQLNGGKLQ